VKGGHFTDCGRELGAALALGGVANALAVDAGICCCAVDAIVTGPQSRRVLTADRGVTDVYRTGVAVLAGALTARDTGSIDAVVSAGAQITILTGAVVEGVGTASFGIALVRRTGIVVVT
jgi:hypothetical protein